MDLLEKYARAICIARGINPDENRYYSSGYGPYGLQWKEPKIIEFVTMYMACKTVDKVIEENGETFNGG